MTHNPFVPYLNRYTTASPDHQAAFDEFIGQAPPPGGALLGWLVDALRKK